MGKVAFALTARFGQRKNRDLGHVADHEAVGVVKIPAIGRVPGEQRPAQCVDLAVNTV